MTTDAGAPNSRPGCANRIHDNKGDAVSARNSANSLIENNEIYANGLTAVAIGGKYGSTSLVIRGNDIHYNGKDGVQGSGDGIVVEDRKSTRLNSSH